MHAHPVKLEGDAGVVSDRTAELAVNRAADTATVDRNAAEDERVAFDREALERVSRMYNDPITQDTLIRAWHRASRAAIVDRRDMDLALALVVLRDRLRRVRGVNYELTAEGMSVLPPGDVPIEEDPWLAERNYGG